MRIIPILLALATATSVYGADVVVLKTRRGDVKFSHKVHQERLKSACTSCHEKGTPGKIESLNRDKAHKTCRGCHEVRRAGPTKCNDCHGK